MLFCTSATLWLTISLFKSKSSSWPRADEKRAKVCAFRCDNCTKWLSCCGGHTKIDICKSVNISYYAVFTSMLSWLCLLLVANGKILHFTFRLSENPEINFTWINDIHFRLFKIDRLMWNLYPGIGHSKAINQPSTQYVYAIEFLHIFIHLFFCSCRFHLADGKNPKPKFVQKRQKWFAINGWRLFRLHKPIMRWSMAVDNIVSIKNGIKHHRAKCNTILNEESVGWSC